jgi:hypothetical protein
VYSPPRAACRATNDAARECSWADHLTFGRDRHGQSIGDSNAVQLPALVR